MSLLDGKVEQGTAGQPMDQSVILLEFLASLNQANRAVLLLFLEGLSTEEIAEVVATSAGSVSTRLTRLKQQFEQTYVETS